MAERSCFTLWSCQGLRRVSGARGRMIAAVLLASLSASSAFHNPGRYIIQRHSNLAASSCWSKSSKRGSGSCPLQREALEARSHPSQITRSLITVMAANSEGQSEKSGSWFRDSLSELAQRILQPFTRLAAIFLIWIRSLLIMRSAWLMQVSPLPCISALMVS
jgi:hypothetical protein